MGCAQRSRGSLFEPVRVRRDLAAVQVALEALAQAYPPAQLAARASALYEQFRPAVPDGVKGWGAKGELRLDGMRALARKGRGPGGSTARVAQRDWTDRGPG
jgi:hypothetical protein